MFRKFNDNEVETLKKLRHKGKIAKSKFNSLDRRIRYDNHGNFVVAVVKTEGCIFTGVAKFNPNDTGFIPQTGQQIALARALMFGGGRT